MNRLISTFLLLLSQSALATGPVTLGPYSNQTDYDVIIAFLKDNQVNYQLNGDAKLESLGFIVVTDPIESASAQVMITELKKNRINDLLYISVGVYEGRVSAGIYSSTKGAQRRVSALAPSSNRFSVLQRTRTIASETITVMPMVVDPTMSNKFKLLTGVEFPLVPDEPAADQPIMNLPDSAEGKESADAKRPAVTLAHDQPPPDVAGQVPAVSAPTP